MKLRIFVDIFGQIAFLEKFPGTSRLCVYEKMLRLFQSELQDRLTEEGCTIDIPMGFYMASFKTGDGLLEYDPDFLCIDRLEPIQHMNDWLQKI